MEQRIAVIDDHRLFVAGLELVLARLGDEVVVESFTGPDQFLSAVSQGTSFSLAILDFYIPGFEVTETLAQIRAVSAGLPILVLSSSVSVADRDIAIAAGASDFVQKHTAPDKLLSVIRQTLSGPGQGGNGQLSEFSVPQIKGLTPRQVEVLALVSKGFSNKEIGRLLEISPETVKSHLKDIFTRFGLRNRVEAIEFTRQMGLG
ncbi:LuxR C-terminal-related transcriptional regulator [Hoeflea prorocentri]|uniref:Response regulator transcription factor n=1 Tax=Hoeflea prorocentri TaxID=1922333 RepID=A0A9X3ZH92_9HYPH|nr:response regulator transcription factor [Hoeflea prorocentri]MCY6381582.1 response regulator transcription factor [Hoeflea prorocentri]MDA5399382.1 response regulator transcription factor [Hoeflea prorocentri]